MTLALIFVSGNAAGASAAISGTAASGLTEAQIVTGGETIIITLTNDTWAAAGTGPVGSTADTQAIIDGITAAESEATGWNAEVRDKEVVGAVVRTSDTVVTITLTAAAAYDVTANETITVTIPAAALVTSSTEVVASPTIGVTADSAVSTARGGYVPPTYVKTRIKKKDKTILAQVHELVAKLEEAPIRAPEKIIKRVDKVAKRAKKVVYMADIKAHQRELTNTANQIKRLQTVVNSHIKAAKEDEDAALKALFEVM